MDCRFGVFASALFFLAAGVAGASATSDISARYDGRYAVTLMRVAAMSADHCPELALRDVEIRGGFIRTERISIGPSFDGFVTGEGFLTGRFKQPGQPDLVFEGRFIGSDFRGGVIDLVTPCAWLVTFSPPDRATR